MKTTNFKKVKESEKAILFIVGFKYNENSKSIVYGIEGEQGFGPGREVEVWMPKSVISEDNTIADWFTKKIYDAFGRFSTLDKLYI